MNSCLNFEASDFTVEHLADTPEARKALESFSASNNANGLEAYLKFCALQDEQSNESRTYLVKDALTGDLACYFSLRTCLVPIQIDVDKFATIPAIELANFAANDNYRKTERAVAKIGSYAFVKFILPIVRHVAKFIGAKWLCIYALPEPKLLAYYTKLGFARLDRQREEFVYQRIKPKYDEHCLFMYQSI